MCSRYAVFSHRRRAVLQYMNLVGGRHQLNVGNNNTNEGFIKITDCLFSMSTGAAIHIVGPSCPEPTCPEPLPQVGSYSSQVIVRDVSAASLLPQGLHSTL